MAKREYIGSPIDATMQYIKERKNKGETVAGTTADDLGDERTDATPEFVDRGEYSDTELGMISNRILHSEASMKELAERFGYNYTTLSSFLSKFRRRHEGDLRDAGLYERMLPPQRRGRDNGGDEGGSAEAERTEEQVERAAAFDYFKQNPDANIHEAIDDLDITHLSQHEIAGSKGNARQSLRSEGVDLNGDIEPEPAERTEQVELSLTTAARLKNRAMEVDAGAMEMGVGEQVETVLDAVEDLRSTAERLRAERASPESDDPAMGELNQDVLYAIVTGKDLTDEQRRAVFDIAVGDRGE